MRPESGLLSVALLNVTLRRYLMRPWDPALGNGAPGAQQASGRLDPAPRSEAPGPGCGPTGPGNGLRTPGRRAPAQAGGLR